jgi:hypothetical protein
MNLPWRLWLSTFALLGLIGTTFAQSPGNANKPIKQRRKLSEDDLRRELAKAPEVGLSAQEVRAIVDSVKAKLANSYAVTARYDWEPDMVLSLRPDLAQLPYRFGTANRIDNRAAAILGSLSGKLRTYLNVGAPKDIRNKRPDPVLLEQRMRQEQRGRKPEWLRPEVVPVLLQLLMHEDRPIRRMLTEFLAEIEGKRATVALAQRTLYDLSPEVREVAIRALRHRPREDFRDVLRGGFQYPWTPVADHAAEALVALDDQESVPQLINLLQMPDPSEPRLRAGGRYLVRELVRLNHQTNCLACHAPAATNHDPVPGVVPGFTVTNVSGGSGGYGSSGPRQVTVAPLLVRADITYLRQDFSIQQPSAPILVGTDLTLGLRFDYLVRTRTLSEPALRKLRPLSPDEPKGQQRQALLFALRELTGKDLGTTYDQWTALLPKLERHEAADADRLAGQFLKAAPGRQEKLLAQLRNSKGVTYTEALAQAIPQLKGSIKDKARVALAERLTRMTAATLRDKLEDPNGEIRRAAVLACISRDEKTLIPDLIPLLEDPEPMIVRVTYTALKTLTGQDFGPKGEADSESWANSATAWKAWWQKQETSGPATADTDSTVGLKKSLSR